MLDPRKAIITEDDNELFHLQVIEDTDEEDEFTQWLLGDDFYDEIDSTQEMSH